MKILIAIFLLGTLAARAQDTNSAPSEPDAISFESFNLIASRNIFDPTRPRRTVTPRPEGAAPLRSESFRLVGALAYEKGHYAFFDGTSSEYRKSVKIGENFAGYKVGNVTSKDVTLEG
jgi:hypothetical protein